MTTFTGFCSIGKIRIYGKNIEKIITVTQLGSEAFIAVSSNQFRVSNELNSVKEFAITSNISWQIASPDWLQLDKNSGIGNSVVEISAAEITAISRQGEIIVYNALLPTLNDTIVITQSPDPSLLIESQIAETEENNPNGLEIFELNITNPNELSVLYSIKEDNIPFSIANGIVSISNSELLDYEKTKKFQFTVSVQEEGNLENYDEAIITINLLNINDCSPQFITGDLSEAITNNEYSEFIQVIDNDFLSDDVSEISVIGELPEWVQFENFGYYATIKGIPTVQDIGENFITLKVSDGIEEEIKEFIINVRHINDPPSDIILSSNSISENVSIGDTVGQFTAVDYDQEDTHTFSFVTGDGTNDADNSSFTIGENNLKTATELDFETKSEYYIYLQVEDEGGLTFEKAFVINILNENEAPNELILSCDSINENVSIGTIIGEFSTTDVDAGDSFTYSFIEGNGINDADNNSFTIEGNNLKTAIELDFETQLEYKIYIQTEDAGGLSYEKAFTIKILNVNDAPTEIILSNDTIEENVEIGTIIGEFASIDMDIGDTIHTYSFASGNGSNDADNSSFSIDSISLKTAVELDYETKSEYHIYVQSEDSGGLTYNKSFVIYVNDVTETGVEDVERMDLYVYPNPTSGIIHIDSNYEISEIFVVNSSGEKVLVAKNKNQIDLSDLPQGIYFLRLINAQDSIIRVVKVVKK